MERHITDEIYNNLNLDNSIEVILAVRALCGTIAKHMDTDEYLQVEEQLYEIFNRLEKEVFHRGFIEGIRFLVKCL